MIKELLDVPDISPSFEQVGGTGMPQCVAMGRMGEPGRLLVGLEESTNHASTESSSGKWRGRAILVPGTSFSGKTTVVAAMVRAGASYYSDEYAVLDSRGRVHPYARPLLVREGDAGLPRQVRVEEIGGRAGHKPLPIGLVVDSPYKPGSTWRPPQLLSPGRGVMALLAHTVPARLRPQFALATLKSVVHHVPVLKGPRGEAEDVAASVLRELENRAA